MTRVTSVIGLSLLLIGTRVHTASANDATSLDPEILRSIGHPLAEDRVFYRWQTTASGENLAKLGVMNEATNTYFMGIKQGAVAGPGIYMAETAHSSETYLPKSGGNLLEVRVKKGTLVIDVTDPAVLRRMHAAGIDEYTLERSTKFADGVLLKYEGDYHVGKNLTNAASFELFPGRDRDATGVRRLIEKMETEGAKAQAAAQILRHRPDLVPEIARMSPIDELSLRLIPPAELPEHIARNAAAFNTTDEIDGLYTHMRVRPDVAKAVLDRPRVAAKLLPKLMRGPLRDDAALAGAPRVLKTALVNSVWLTDEERVRAAHDLARALLREVSTSRNLSAHLEEITKLLGRGPLDDKTRRLVASTAAILTQSERTNGDLGPIRTLMSAGGLADSPQAVHLDTIERRRESFARAMKTKSSEDVARALADHTDFEQFQETAKHLRSAVPAATYDGAVKSYVSRHPADLGVMLKDHKAWHEATNAALDRTLGADFLPNLYQAALDAPPSNRAWFLEPCLRREDCAKFFLSKLRADPAPFFRGVGDLNTFAALARELDSPLTRDIVRAALPGLGSPQLASFASALEDAPKLMPLVLAHAENLDTTGLRSRQLLRLARVFDRDTKGRDRMLSAAVHNVVTPSEAEYVASMIKDERTERGLAKALTHRLAELEPTPAEVARFNHARPFDAPIEVRTFTEMDCLGRLVRQLAF